MKRYAVVLCGLDEVVEIKFYNANGWREAALQAARAENEDFPLWDGLTAPDASDEEDEETESPTVVPTDLQDAREDASNGDRVFAIAEVPA